MAGIGDGMQMSAELGQLFAQLIAQLGIGAIFAFFCWYLVTKQIPKEQEKSEARFKEMSEKALEQITNMQARFDASRQEDKDHFREILGMIAKQFLEELKRLSHEIEELKKNDEKPMDA